jgi:DNA-binding NarL/FixJ family response regulator
MGRPTVLIADDHDSLRSQVCGFLAGTFDIVAAVADGGAAVHAAALLRPDVVVFDISMPVLNGLDAAVRLAELGLPSRVIFLTVHDDEAFVRAAQSVGACAYVLKCQMGTQLPRAIRHALSENARFLAPSLP